MRAAFKASVFSPLNGWKLYMNDRRSCCADRFWSWAATDRTLSTTIARVSIPVSLIYGSRDLIAPAEIGQTIYGKIQTLEDLRPHVGRPLQAATPV